MDLNSSHSATLGLFLIFGSLICLGTWPTLLRLCTIFTFDTDKNRTKQTKWKKFFGQGRHPCHVYLDYAMSYVFVGSFLLPWFFYSKSEGVSYTDPNMKPLLWLAAFVGGSLLALGNLTTQWSTAAFGAPLTTVLALQASMCVILGTYWNYRLQPEKTSNPILLLTGVGMFLVAIACSVAAQTIYQTQKYRSFTLDTLKDEETISVYDVDSGDRFSGVSLTPYHPDDYMKHVQCSQSLQEVCVGAEVPTFKKLEHNDSFSSYGSISLGDCNRQAGKFPNRSTHSSLSSSPYHSSKSNSTTQGSPPMRIPSYVQLITEEEEKKSTCSTTKSILHEVLLDKVHAPDMDDQTKPDIGLSKQVSLPADNENPLRNLFSKELQVSVGDDLDDDKGHKIGIGVAVAMFGGVCFGFFSPLFNVSVNDPFNWYSNSGLSVSFANSCFATSFALSSIVWNMYLMWYPPKSSGIPKSNLREYLSKQSFQERYLAVMAGALCGVGNLLQFQGGALAGFAAADMVQAFPLVATVWDLIVFGEFRQCSSTVLLNLTSMYAAYLLGISFLASSISL